jgi:hypothetical protein
VSEEQGRIEYLRDIIKKATPDSDTAMVISPEGWAGHLTWALDEIEANYRTIALLNKKKR